LLFPLLPPAYTANSTRPNTNGTIAIGTGGRFGQIVKSQLIQSILQPARSNADPFNIPNDWTPPFSADLFGGTPGESSVPHYLETAKASAQAAADSVNTAMSGLLQQQQDIAQASLTEDQKQVALGASALKAQQGLQEDRAKECGLNNTNCDIALKLQPLSTTWYTSISSEQGCAALYSTMYDDVYKSAIFDTARASSGLQQVLDDKLGPYPAAPVSMPRADENAALTAVTKVVGWAMTNLTDDRISGVDAALGVNSMACSASHSMDDFLALQTSIAQPVSTYLDTLASTAPGFEDFAGGTLQSALIEQWSAIKSPDEMFNSMLKALDAMKSRVDAASALIGKAEADVKRQCSLAVMLLAFEAGWSTGFLDATWSPGPLIAQENRCEDARINAGPEIASAIADRKGAISSFTSSLQGFLGAQTRIQQAAAALEAAEADAKIADTRVQTEKNIQDMLANAQYQNVLATSFGLYRRYRDYDLWQASAQLEVARRQAAIARRAIESQYVVDMSRMTADETFVASPRTWADEIYEYDLSLPAAVGLTVSSSSSGSDAIVANKVVDYVSNLQSFIDGYSTTRPSAIAKDDIDVITLPGLALGSPTSTTVANLYPDQGTWLAHCAANDTWSAIPAGVLPDDQLCAGTGANNVRPDRLRLTFELDPYGQPPASSGTVQYQYRYNARWTKLAINLVGTAVIDCDSATDPLVCYSKGYIPYTLTHVGNPPVTDFSGVWHNIPLPQGRIEDGKAVALERWLEPLQDGWNTAYISAVARTEFSHRPLGGEYVLEFALTPEIHAENIERVQIMMGSEYWVAQK
jgi:hypothetical protein